MKVWTLFIDDPGPGCSFKEEQLADMLKQEKELRSLINNLQHFDRVIGSKKAITRRIGAAFTRVF